jgi:hypothetical protein
VAVEEKALPAVKSAVMAYFRSFSPSLPAVEAGSRPLWIPWRGPWRQSNRGHDLAVFFSGFGTVVIGGSRSGFRSLLPAVCSLSGFGRDHRDGRGRRFASSRSGFMTSLYSSAFLVRSLEAVEAGALPAVEAGLLPDIRSLSAFGGGPRGGRGRGFATSRSGIWVPLRVRGFWVRGTKKMVLNQMSVGDSFTTT